MRMVEFVLMKSALMKSGLAKPWLMKTELMDPLAKAAALMIIAVISAGIAASIALAANSIIITEVLYDPANESGGEAVEIYNPLNESINIGSWAIATESSSTDATIPAGTVLSAGRHYLIADAGWGFIHPDAVADYEEAITLANIDAGIALINSNGTLVDAVGWGNASNIGSGLFEGSPAAITDEGQSLQRKKLGGEYIDTSNNSADFLAASPDFRNSSFGGSSNSEIQVYAHIFSIMTDIGKINITTDDDSSSAGIQVMPIPKAARQLSVRAAISGSIANASVTYESGSYAMSRIAEINSTSGIYEANISIPFYLAPGNHTFIVSAVDYSNRTYNSSAVFELMSLLSIELDTGALAFSASPGGIAEINGDLNTSSSDKVTIRNTGNTAVDFELSGTDLTYGASTISVGSLSYTFGSDYSSPSSAGTLSTSKQKKNIGLLPGASSLQQLSFRLNVPQGASSGNYSGRIYIAAVS